MARQQAGAGAPKRWKSVLPSDPIPFPAIGDYAGLRVVFHADLAMGINEHLAEWCADLIAEDRVLRKAYKARNAEWKATWNPLVGQQIAADRDVSTRLDQIRDILASDKPEDQVLATVHLYSHPAGDAPDADAYEDAQQELNDDLAAIRAKRDALGYRMQHRALTHIVARIEGWDFDADVPTPDDEDSFAVLSPVILDWLMNAEDGALFLVKEQMRSFLSPAKSEASIS